MKEQLFSKISVSQTIVALCEAKGINQIVISPGSRNAPLIIGFSEHPKMHCYSIVDERCAAFFGLGLASQIQKPVVLICTSGSALLNYYPAIAEAFYSDIPLIVMSADRPIERIDIGDGQTIRQKNVFQNHILYNANLYSEMVPQTQIKDQKIKQKQREAQRHNEREINQALNIAISEQGPVHINVPFYEPLYDKVTKPIIIPKNIAVEYSMYSMKQALWTEICAVWNNTQKKMVLIGVSQPGAMEQKWIKKLSEDPSVLVLTETTSNVHHASHISCIDQFITPLNEHQLALLQPEVLLTFGGFIVSKRIKNFLRAYSPTYHWHVDEKKAYDTYFCLSDHIRLNPNIFFESFFSKIKPSQSTYKQDWITVRDVKRKKHQEYLDQQSFSDLKVFEKIFNKIPTPRQVHLSNSSTIRYAQLFELNSQLSIYCNRGTSGIEGSTSTAIGASLVSKDPVLLITGDLSFLYDSNALWNSYIPSHFKIIVINNNGGGIFRILPGKEESDHFSTFFETTHGYTAEHLCKMYDFKYFNVSTLEELDTGIKNLFSDNKSPALLEIFTPRLINDKILLNYFDFLK